jgi:hypothetical protein
MKYLQPAADGEGEWAAAETVTVRSTYSGNGTVSHGTGTARNYEEVPTINEQLYSNALSNRGKSMLLLERSVRY